MASGPRVLLSSKSGAKIRFNFKFVQQGRCEDADPLTCTHDPPVHPVLSSVQGAGAGPALLFVPVVSADFDPERSGAPSLQLHVSVGVTSLLLRPF